ncbi:MAG: hypothetical protein GY820_35875 [Gammaproteobacteria bacterium]|nr:hypothetical protein [Gammaproteobacteria bacterium]
MNLQSYADSTIEKSSFPKLYGCAEKFINQLFSQIDVIEWDGYEKQEQPTPDLITMMLQQQQRQEEKEERRWQAEREERKRQEEERKRQEEERRAERLETLQVFQTMLQQQNNNNNNDHRPQPLIDKKGPPITPFSGEGSKGQKKDFAQWLPQYEECARVFSYNDNMKLFWLKHKLSGVAQTFMETQDEEVKDNYDRLIDVLSAYFKDTTSITMRYKEAFNCTQSQGESVVEFKEKVSANSRNAEQLTPLTADLARKHVFLLGLQDDYKADLVSKCDDNMTFEQVANLTVDLEKQ